MFKRGAKVENKKWIGRHEPGSIAFVKDVLKHGRTTYYVIRFWLGNEEERLVTSKEIRSYREW